MVEFPATRLILEGKAGRSCGIKLDPPAEGCRLPAAPWFLPAAPCPLLDLPVPPNRRTVVPPNALVYRIS